MDDVLAELEACLKTIRAQAEEIQALRATLSQAMSLLDLMAQQRTTAPVKRSRGRPPKHDHQALLQAFEAMSADYKRAKPRTAIKSDIQVLQWFFRREWSRAGREPRGGLLVWERKLKTFQNALSKARNASR